jgi:hypothetical protein
MRLLPFSLAGCPKCGNVRFNDDYGMSAWGFSYFAVLHRSERRSLIPPFRRIPEHLRGRCGRCKATWQMRTKEDHDLVAEILKDDVKAL